MFFYQAAEGRGQECTTRLIVFPKDMDVTVGFSKGQHYTRRMSVYSLEAVSRSEAAVSLTKCMLDTLPFPPTENLERRCLFCQSQMLCEVYAAMSPSPHNRDQLTICYQLHPQPQDVVQKHGIAE